MRDLSNVSEMNPACSNAYRDWEQVIIAANRDYEIDAYNMARMRYLSAISIANSMIEIAPCARPVVGALLVSYHNLADLFERLKQQGEAAKLHQTLQTHIHKLAYQFPDSPVLCWGQRIAWEQLYLFQQRNDDPALFNTNQNISPVKTGLSSTSNLH